MKLYNLIAICSLSLCSFNIAKADTIDSAYTVCSALDKSGSLSEECKVSGWNQSVDISLAMTAPDAMTTCNAIVKSAAKNKLRFDKGWKLRIYSPYSGKRTIATCSF